MSSAGTWDGFYIELLAIDWSHTSLGEINSAYFQKNSDVADIKTDILSDNSVLGYKNEIYISQPIYECLLDGDKRKSGFRVISDIWSRGGFHIMQREVYVENYVLSIWLLSEHCLTSANGRRNRRNPSICKFLNVSCI